MKDYFLNKQLNRPDYTLILDLDETLIHYIKGKQESNDIEEDYYLIRPHTVKFLKEVSKYYELVIFTAGTKGYADPIIDDIDPEYLISYRLYRHHTYGDEDEYIKDIELIGRDLKSTIIVDNTCDNFKHQKDNGIHIRSWYDDYTDCRLKKLSSILIQIAKSKPKDIAKELKMYREDIQKHIE